LNAISLTTFLIDKKADINISPEFYYYPASHEAGPVPIDLPKIKIFSGLISSSSIK